MHSSKNLPRNRIGGGTHFVLMVETVIAEIEKRLKQIYLNTINYTINLAKNVLYQMSKHYKM